MEIVDSNSSSNGQIALPVPPEQLGKFISSLLGQPQTLEREISGPFDIDQAWVTHLCAMIFQRVNQQNLAEPLTFEATITYRDNVKRKIQTFPAFEHFSESKKLVSTGIKISIAFLIKFPNKETPEKQ